MPHRPSMADHSHRRATAFLPGGSPRGKIERAVKGKRVSPTLSPSRRVDIVGVPMDLGASRRGVDMGPSAIRYAKLHEKLRRSASPKSSITEICRSRFANRPTPKTPPRSSSTSSPRSATILPCWSKKRSMPAALPIVLGGDHSIAMGTLDGLTRAYGEPPGLVWIDAHADINSPDSSASRQRARHAALLCLEKGARGAGTLGSDRLARRRPR